MTVKSLKKQLMAAIAMVLVSVLALSSATFAWFANNNKVTADGMKINAKAEGSLLLIADSAANLFNAANGHKTSVTLAQKNIGADLLPVHAIYDGISGKAVTAWNHAFSDAFNTAVTATGSNEEALTLSEGSDGVAKDASDNAYYLKTSIFIGLDNANEDASCGAVTVTGVTITETNTDTADAMLESARVLMVVDGTVVGNFGNGKCLSAKGADQSGTFGADGFVAAKPDTLTAISATNTATIIDGLEDGESVEVVLYLYFDGRDNSCTSENFDADKLAIELEFTAEAN